MTKKEWDRIVQEVIALGLNPAEISEIDANHREALPFDSEWPEHASHIRAEIKGLR